MARGLAAAHDKGIVHRDLKPENIFATSAILKEDPPDLPVAERHISPPLARIVDRYLEKNPAARFQTASDLGFALEAIATHSGQAEIGGAIPAVSSRRFPGRLASAAAGGLTATIITRPHKPKRIPGAVRRCT